MRNEQNASAQPPSFQQREGEDGREILQSAAAECFPIEDSDRSHRPKTCGFLAAGRSLLIGGAIPARIARAAAWLAFADSSNAEKGSTLGCVAGCQLSCSKTVDF